MVVIAGRIRIDPRQHGAAVAAAVAMMRATRAEPGCISYTFSSDLEEPGVFRLFEEWESPAALERHFSAPHMATFRAAIAKLGVQERAVRRYEVTSVSDL